MVDHLVELGHERIVHTSQPSGGLKRPFVLSHTARCDGYVHAMKRHGLHPDVIVTSYSEGAAPGGSRSAHEAHSTHGHLRGRGHRRAGRAPRGRGARLRGAWPTHRHWVRQHPHLDDRARFAHDGRPRRSPHRLHERQARPRTAEWPHRARASRRGTASRRPQDECCPIRKARSPRWGICREEVAAAPLIFHGSRRTDVVPRSTPSTTLSWALRSARPILAITDVERFVERTRADPSNLGWLETVDLWLERAGEAGVGVGHRPPEAGAQVRILPGAPPLTSTYDC